MKRNHKFIITLCVALIFSACAKKEVKVEQKIINVKTATVTEKEYMPMKQYSGSIQAWKEANLGASLPGRVEKFYVKEGQNVSEGQLIAQLSDEMFTQVEIEHKAIAKDFQRVAQLFEKGSISEMEYDHLKAKLDASQEKYNLLKKNTQIRAPFSGTVVEYLVNEGENFSIMPALSVGYSHSSGIVRLMQMKQMKVEIQVNEKDLSVIKKGLIAQIKCDAYPDEVFKGEITDIKPILSNISRTSCVEIAVSNPSNKLMPGMYCRVSLNMPKDKGIFIPRYALMKLSGTNENFVYVSENNQAVKKNVEIIDSIGDEVIVKGLNAGEEVITAGKTKVSDGSQIKLNGGHE